MRKISTFEIIDGDIIKEHVWDAEDFEEEDLSLYLQASGYDSFMTMFTFGLPLYILALAYV
jgi:hypothetical protein